MLEDLNDHPPGTRIRAQICIAGAGAAGITVARELLSQGLEVCLLESGGLDFEPDTQDLADGPSTGHEYYALKDARLRMFGGTTSIWGGRCALLDEVDFERRDWVTHSGWPFDRNHLLPYYRRAQQQLELETMLGDESSLRSHGRTPPPFEPEKLRTALWQFDRRADRFAIASCQDLVQNKSARILLHASVVGIECDRDGGHVRALRVRSLQGSEATIEADQFVLAMGGLETPRVLLNARDQHAEGVGNQHDLVGRFFMEHPHARGGEIKTPDFSAVMNMLPRSYLWRGERYAALVRPGEKAQADKGLLNSSMTFAVRQPPAHDILKAKKLYLDLKESLRPNRLNRALWHLNRKVLLWARGAVGPAVAAYRYRYGGDSLYAVIRAEQAPNPDSRVMLDDSTDAFGLQRLKLDWRFDQIDKHTVTGMMGLLDEEFRRLNIGTVVPEPWLTDEGLHWHTDNKVSNHPIGGFHHMGTTRMAVSEREGVVDPDARVHGMSNLYVAGSSVFPTSGWANPTLTIMALSIRLADRLAALQRTA